MPYFEKGNLRLYYEDVGKGDAIIANHGLSEDANYWSETGVTAALSKKYRMISIDMRGHGRTVVEGEPYGYDPDTMAQDFDDLADYLGIEKFHLLTHATGGMVGARYTMKRSDRLLSSILTDTSSNTQIEIPDYREFTEEEKKERSQRAEVWEKATEDEKEKLRETWIAMEMNATVEDRMAAIRQEPGPYLFKMAEHPESEKMLKIYEGFLRRQDRRAIINFMTSFYTDPNPRIEELRQVKCPTLVLLGEYDIVFLKPSEIMAKEIPDVRHVIMPGLGHMTAIEDPERFIAEILDFLETVEQTGKANC
ncbi:MAG: alpha/beta fold hydrolase [Promethearchaeota archaeon]|jgi:pimeloyl-ACP methyl ester carboxylesterase